MPHRDSISLDNGQYSPDEGVALNDGEAPVYAPYAENGEERAYRPNRLPDRRSRVPAHAPRPMDHQPKKSKKRKRDKPRNATQAEAEGIETATVEYDGETYEIPADTMDWELPVTEAFESGRVVTAIRGLLGPRQYQVLLGKGYRNRQFAELFQLLAEAGGFESPGN